MKNKGICNLAVIPLRKHPESAAEMVSQLLFGEIFEIRAIKDGWVEIITDRDQYHGYISQKQYTLYQQEITGWQVSTGYPFSLIHTETGTLLVPPGSSLPVAPKFNLGIHAYSNQEQQQVFTSSDLQTIALRYLGVPYLWGGKTPFGIDCSGFTQTVFLQCGITLPRDAYQQAETGTQVSFVGETQTGDLAFFDNEEGRITHVGIMLNNQEIIHASGQVRIDTLDHYGIMNKDEKQYSHKLRIIKRLF